MAIILDGTNGISTPDVEPTGSTVPTNGLYLPAANSVGIATNSTNAVYINSSQNVGIGTSSPSYGLDIRKSTGGISWSTDPQWWVKRDSGAEFLVQPTSSLALVGTFSNHSVAITTNNTERMRIDSSGNLLVGTTSTLGTAKVTIKTPDGSGSQIPLTLAVGIVSDGFGGVSFRNPNGAQGGITINSTTVSYNTTSDYRLKENVQPMIGALATVAQLKPCTYIWKANGSAGQGFIAHELQAVVPDCVTGEKDAIDEEGKPQYQGVDTSFLVATLTAAIKEQQAIIEQQSQAIASLTTRIAALEAK